jgi:hypothetical protein
VVYYAGSSASGPSLSSSPVNAGTYTAMASYAGDGNYAAAQSAAVTFTINRATTTVALAAPPASIVYDGTSDVTNWVSATVTGVGGAPAPTGSPVFTYYAGNSASGTPLGASPIAAGSYTVVANYGGNGNYLPSQSGAVSFTIQTPAPSSTVNVASFKVNDGSAQRSMVDSLSVTFSAPVTLAAGAIVLTTQSGTAVPFQLSTADYTTYTLTFSGAQFIGGSLANGRYVLTVNHALVSGPGGGVMAASQSYSFFRLFGDYYGTGTVTNADYALFKKAFDAVAGSSTYATYWYFDYYDSGTINNNDLTEFLDYYGTSI